MDYQSVNPYDGKLTKTFSELADDELETVLRKAATCYETWRRTSFAERTAVVEKVAALMRARLATMEMGKRVKEARGEIELSAQILCYYAMNAERFLAPVKLHPTLGEAYMESNPLGIRLRHRPVELSVLPAGPRGGPHLMELGDMGIQEFVNKKLVRVAAMDAPE